MFSSGESETSASVMADAAVQCQLYSVTPLCPPTCVVVEFYFAQAVAMVLQLAHELWYLECVFYI